MIKEIKTNAEVRMKKSLEALKNDLGKLRTGRAHTGLLDHVMVEYYGNKVPLPQVASVTLLDARTLNVVPWEKQMLQPVDKAIRESDLGLNPTSSSDSLRVPMPALSEERRRELIKVAKGEAEQAKVAVRNLRRDANNALKEASKAKTISQDDERRTEDEVQKMTDRFIVEVDKMLAAKEEELLAV